MRRIRVQDAAGRRIDDIFLYTRERWGEAQAERYIRGLFARLEAIAAEEVAWRRIPPAFGVDGYLHRYEAHFIYWRVLSDGDVGVVTVLHARMHQIARFRDDFEA